MLHRVRMACLKLLYKSKPMKSTNHAQPLGLLAMRESKSLAVKCKTHYCGAKIPLLSAVRSIFPKRESIASILCPLGHRNQYTEADVIDTGRRIQTSEPIVGSVRFSKL